MKKGNVISKLNKLKNFDYTLLFIVIFILAFGLVMLYSTSAYAATLKKGSSTYYLKKQMMAAALGFCGMFVTAKIDYKFWKNFIGIIYAISMVLCVSVYFVGVTINESTRWLKIPGTSITVQPSEIAKIAVIIFLAYVISKGPKKQRSFKTSCMTIVTILPFVVVVGLSNLSTAVIILGIACIMVFVASPQYAKFSIIIAAGLGFIAIYIAGAGYRSSRIDSWLHPEEYTSGTGFQTLQGLYAIGSGGLFGKGLGESLQKYIVPEAQNDMIFSIICEELGVFGGVCVILMYILLLYRLLYIANHARDMFGSYICIGIMAHIALQVILNIAVVTNTIPNTGITLPLISYGGTSVAILLTEIGLALSVSKSMEFEDEM